MKTSIKKIAFLVVTFLLVTKIFSSGQVKTDSLVRYKTIEKNLLVGLKSDNQGLQFSCAYYLGEIKSKKAVIPLMKILHSSKVDGMRIIAALSLYKINSEQGMFAVKQAAKFDNCERVQRMCRNFYFKHLLDEKGVVEVEEIQIAEMKALKDYKLADFEK
ncbi:MAG: hypothetical protein IPM32_07325 [Ignavibacteriae bacterium]|nr:hypothetical protein [Ignavibacteriota bacterium]